MRWRVAAGTRFHQARPWARMRDVPILHAGNLMVVLVTEGAAEPATSLGRFSGEFIATAGTDALLTLIGPVPGQFPCPAARCQRGERRLGIRLPAPARDAHAAWVRTARPEKSGHAGLGTDLVPDETQACQGLFGQKALGWVLAGHDLVVGVQVMAYQRGVDQGYLPYRLTDRRERR